MDQEYQLYKDEISKMWKHDRRRKQTTQEYDPSGREAGTYVTTSEEDKKREQKKGNLEPEQSTSDCYKQYGDELCNAWRKGK